MALSTVALLLLPLLSQTSPLGDNFCGDSECGLTCAQDQDCLPTGTNCIMAPCCEAWTCEASRTQDSCPAEWPNTEEGCAPGMHCEYGIEECCGEMVPDVIFECDGDGDWQMIIVDSLCDFGLPCPEESTTVPRHN